MTRFRLGINTCFAVKRWPLPEDWAQIVRDELRLDLVQHSFDLVDLFAPRPEVTAQAAAVRAACRRHGLLLHSTFTGLAAYSGNLLMHPDPGFRRRGRETYRRMIDFTAELGAGSTGGHVGALSVADWRDPDRRSWRWDELRGSLAELAVYARTRGLTSLMVENLAAAREPATMADLRSLLTPGDARAVPIRLCLDVGHQCVPGSSGEDRDPYAWLRELGTCAPVVQLQQSDGLGDHHWPFTPRHNEVGVIDADRVLATLVSSGAEDVALVLEVIPAFEADDDEVLEDLRWSATYWRDALARSVRG